MTDQSRREMLKLGMLTTGAGLAASQQAFGVGTLVGGLCTPDNLPLDMDDPGAHKWNLPLYQDPLPIMPVAQQSCNFVAPPTMKVAQSFNGNRLIPRCSIHPSTRPGISVTTIFHLRNSISKSFEPSNTNTTVHCQLRLPCGVSTAKCRAKRFKRITGSLSSSAATTSCPPTG